MGNNDPRLDMAREELRKLLGLSGPFNRAQSNGGSGPPPLRSAAVNPVSDLKKTYDELARGIAEFDRTIKPFTDILEAIAELRLQPLTDLKPQTDVPSPFIFDGVLDHPVSVRRRPISYRSRYLIMG